MAEAGDGSGHTPLTPEWTPAPRASHYPWQGDRSDAGPSSEKLNPQCNKNTVLTVPWIAWEAGGPGTPGSPGTPRTPLGYGSAPR